MLKSDVFSSFFEILNFYGAHGECQENFRARVVFNVETLAFMQRDRGGDNENIPRMLDTFRRNMPSAVRAPSLFSR